MCLPHLLTGISWGHIKNKVCALEPIFQNVFPEHSDQEKPCCKSNNYNRATTMREHSGEKKEIYKNSLFKVVSKEED